MIDAGIVHGSAEMAVPVYYGKHRIDVHTDIHEVELPEEMGGGTVWEYHEYQYTINEFMEVMMRDINGNEDGLFDVAELAGENSDGIYDLAEMVADLEDRVSALEG